MKKSKWIILALLSLSLVLAACAPSLPPTPSEAEIAQQVASTQQAKATQNSVETLVALVTELSNQPTWTPQPACPVCPTQVVVVPTAATTPNPNEATAQPTTAPTAEAGKKCFQFDFLGDVNYPPGTIVKPGTKFSKTWTVKNTGTCTWSRDYDVVFVGGEAFGSNKRGDITREVVPGDIIEITIEGMTAPQTEGTYYSYWMIAAPDGARVGYGPNQQWGLGIELVVSKN
ncbi:MAG: NBR1-Ig-like domain-containing protein [Anaerolineaceae bacterium]|nr:NBR1-Ig-like domain-containing protein [Anaerolineaceae bacterium]